MYKLRSHDCKPSVNFLVLLNGESVTTPKGICGIQSIFCLIYGPSYCLWITPTTEL